MATVPAPVLQLQYQYTSIIKCFLIPVQDFEFMFKKHNAYCVFITLCDAISTLEDTLSTQTGCSIHRMGITNTLGTFTYYNRKCSIHLRNVITRRARERDHKYTNGPSLYQYSKTCMIKEKQFNFHYVLLRSPIRPCAAAQF